MAKKPSRQLTKTAPPSAPVAPEPCDRLMGNELVRVDAVYHVKQIAPKAAGPWNAEAEKVAWTDAATGLGCIIRRAADGGHLCGYVGVGPEHPLFGYEAPALRSVGLRAHGGINYAANCQRHETERSSQVPVPESRSICHVPTRTVYHTTREGRTVLEVAVHDDMWWIGFECGHPTDVIPNLLQGPILKRQSTAPDGTVEKVYRDEGYVLDQCRWLAAQLKAIGDGRDLEEVQERAIPPLGHNPALGGR